LYLNRYKRYQTLPGQKRVLSFLYRRTRGIAALPAYNPLLRYNLRNRYGLLHLS